MLFLLNKKSIGFLIILFLVFNSVYAEKQLIAFQGKVENNSVLLANGDLQVLLYDANVGGNLVYDSSSDFNGTISNGYFDIVLGSGSVELDINYGSYYYLDMKVNGTDIDFNGLERQKFEASRGTITDLIVPSISILEDVDKDTNISVAPSSSTSSNIINMFTSGVRRLTITADGNIGIGTYSPFYKLDIVGDVNAEQYCLTGDCISSWSSAGIDTNVWSASWLDNSNALTSDLNGGTHNLFNFVDGNFLGNLYVDGNIQSGTGTIILDGSNNRLGIGTLFPSYKLDVIGDVNAEQYCLTGDCISSWNDVNANANFVPYTGATGNVDLGDNNFIVDTNTLFVNSANHRVGIGTATPNEKLHVKGNIELGGGGYINADNDWILRRNGSNVVRIESGGLQMETSGIWWNEWGSTTSYLGIPIQPADNSPKKLTIYSQSAKATATNYQDGANIYIYGGNHATGGGSFGNVILSHDVTTNRGNVGIGTTAPDEKLQVAGNIHIDDNYKSLYGTGKDSSIYYDGTDMIINPAEVGSGSLKVSGSLEIANSLTLPVTTKTADYTATISDYTIIVDATSNTVTITLPASSGITGRIYNIKCINATYTVTVDGNASETIDATTTKTLAQWDNLKIQSDGTNWIVI